MKLYKNKDLLHQKYIIENISQKKLAKEIKCGGQTIYRWLKKFNIHKSDFKDFRYKDKNWLHEKYINEKLSAQKVGKLCNVGHTAVLRWLTRHNIPRRDRNDYETTREMIEKMIAGIPRGKNHSNWKGGRRINSQGYVLVYQPVHPFKNQGNCVREHRLVMEKHIGRYLHSWEIVHHKNGIKDDNRIENLELLSGQGKHNTEIQKVYKENLKLKQLTLFLLALINKLNKEN